MARAIWKASLALGDATLPVKLYSAVEDRGVHFRLLHREDAVPVKQQLVDPRSGEEVAREEVQRGLPLGDGRFALLHPEELAAAEPPASRSIELTRFVPRDAVDIGWFRRPYLLGPDGDPEAYFALAQALRESGRYGIARWVMRRKRHAGALTTRDEYLALVALHDANEVIASDKLERPDGPPVSKGERTLAEQLVSALDAPFAPEALQDEYRERVRALIAARAEGREIEVPEEPVAAPRDDLAGALRESLRAAKERRVA